MANTRKITAALFREGKEAKGKRQKAEGERQRGKEAKRQKDLQLIT